MGRTPPRGVDQLRTEQNRPPGRRCPPTRLWSRAQSASACEPYRELFIEALRRGPRTPWPYWQDLVDNHGFTAPVCQRAPLRRASSARLPSPEARIVITTAPGEEAQADSGEGPMVRHPQTGKYRRTRLFVLDTRLLAQSGPTAGVAVEHAGLRRGSTSGRFG